MEAIPTTPQIVDVGSVVEAISGNDFDAPVYEVESLCMRCHDNGITRFLLTIIPQFRKILLSAFECPCCGERNNYVQFAGEIQPKGCHYLLDVPSGDKKMFNRQVVKSETATIKIPELDFEIPPEAQRGSLSTVEGILLRAADELDALQEERKETALLRILSNRCAPSPDPSLTIKFYERTPEQQATLGYLADPSQGEPGIENNLDGTNNDSQTQEEPHGSVGARAGRRAIAQGNNSEIADALFRYSAPKEVMTFPTTCSGCGTKCDCRMFVTNIPYFQEVIVMASTCDGCGYRNSEVKAGGAIPDKGKKIIVHVKNVRDLSHDVIKSDTAAVKIPELELELSSGTLGGLVTTLEGLISKIGENHYTMSCPHGAPNTCYHRIHSLLPNFRAYLQLTITGIERVHGFTFGDSMDDSRKSKWKEFRAKLEQLKILVEPWTLILDDALANSFVAPISDEIKDDIQLSFEEYERSWEQNEELGLNDMDTSSADVAYLSADVEPNEKTDA
ncbi:ZPR1 zinc-finger domain protein [Perilla frutescens var. hirtella]|nr:ZPR1 zinc-finger domain protein [Perilla frutescens var. hirtella]